MCYDMRRYEKLAEEKKRRQKEQDVSIAVEDQPEIPANARRKKTTATNTLPAVLVHRTKH